MTGSFTKPTRAAELERLAADADPVNAKDATPLRVIGVATHASEAADATLRAAVEAARAADLSWASIGATPGVSRQAVQKRFGGG